MHNRTLAKAKKYKNESWAISANLLGPVAQLAPILFTLKYVSPEELGTFQAIFLTVTYFAFVPLGVFSGLSRNIPVFEGNGEHQKAQDQIATSWTVAHATALIGILTGLTLTIYHYNHDSGRFAIICSLALMVNLYFTAYASNITALFAGTQSYGKLGSAKMLGNASAIFTSWLPYLLGALALPIRNLIIAIMPSLVYFFTKKNTTSSKSKFSVKDYRDLVTTGLPLTLSGYLRKTLFIADQSIIALYLGKESLGVYALSTFLIMAITQVPRSFSLVFFPKSAFAYGKAKNPVVLRKYAILLIFANLCALLPVCLIAYFSLNYVIELFPKYQGGLNCAKIACYTGVIMSYAGAGIVFMVLKKNLLYQIILLISLASFWLIGKFLINHGYGIEAIAYTRLGITATLATFVMCWAFWLTRPAKNSNINSEEKRH